MVTFTKLNAMLWKIKVGQSYKKEGTPGRHEPPLYKNEPPDLLGRRSLSYAVMSMRNTSNCVWS